MGDLSIFSRQHAKIDIDQLCQAFDLPGGVKELTLHRVDPMYFVVV